MGEQKTITLTVPYHEDPIRRADGALWDGRDRTGAAKDGRSIAVLHEDIGKALLASWPGEPEDLSEGDAPIGEDRPCFTGSKEATIAKLAAAVPALAADVARANGAPLTASLPLLNIEAHGATAQELAEDLVDQLRFVWRTYGCADVDTLTPDARRLRDAARALFASGDVAPSVDRRGNAP